MFLPVENAAVSMTWEKSHYIISVLCWDSAHLFDQRKKAFDCLSSIVAAGYYCTTPLPIYILSFSRTSMTSAHIPDVIKLTGNTLVIVRVACGLLSAFK